MGIVGCLLQQKCFRKGPKRTGEGETMSDASRNQQNAVIIPDRNTSASAFLHTCNVT